jgi:hypothetical protein
MALVSPQGAGEVPTPPANVPDAGWFADPSGAPTWRYWDGAAWTDHVSPMNHPVTFVDGDLKPGLVAVWIMAVLSIAIFTFSYTNSRGETTRVILPLGLVFVAICWRLVHRAQQNAAERNLPVPGAYAAARIVSLVLGTLCVAWTVVGTSV